MREIAKEISDKNITKENGKFFVNGSETALIVVIMLLKSNNKIKSLPDSKVEELLNSHFEQPVIVDNNVTTGSDTIVLEIKDKAILPNKDCEFLKPFKYSKDLDGNVIYHVVIDNLYYKIRQTANGKVLIKDAMEYTGLHDKFYTSFENLLLKWSKNICELYNAEREYEAQEYIENNIPVIILKKFKVCLKVTLPQNNNQKTYYKYVDFQKSDTKRISYIDYLEEVFETFGTLALEESPMPEIFTNDPNTPAYHRFDIRPFMKDEKIELSESWEEVFSKYTEDEKKIMLAWIWGVFDSKNTTRAALYNADLDGYTGKSALTKALGKILGENLVGALQKDSLSNQFGLAKIWDKRLVVMPDSKNPNVIRSEKIHQLLGDDYADIENKGEKSFTRILSSKVWINSNIMPVFDSEARHENSRIIIVKPKMSEQVLKKLAAKNEDGSIMYDSYNQPVLVGDSNFSTNLCNTSASMLTNAYQMYKLLCPNNADFIIPDSVQENNKTIQPTDIGNYEYIFENLVEVCEDGFTPKEELYQYYMDFCKSKSAYSSFATQFIYSDFLTNYVEKNRKFKIIRSTKHNRRRGYVGIKLKTSENFNDKDFVDMLNSKNEKIEKNEKNMMGIE